MDLLKRLVDSLGFLSEALQQDVAQLRSSLQPHERGRGINSFPDDVLSVLFQWIWTAEPIHGRQTVLRVCSRFRRVAINLPRYWSYISPLLPSVGYVEKSLARSKATNLDIHLIFNEEDRYWPDRNNVPVIREPYRIRDLALKCSERWESLRINPFTTRPNDTGFDDWNTSEEKCSPLMDLNLPQLRHLFIEAIKTSHWKEPEGTTQDEKCIHFYTTLNAPSLQFLRVENLIPRPFVAPTPKLAIFELKIADRTICFDYFIPFLATISSTLEELSVDIRERHRELVWDERSVVTFENLKRLRFRYEESKDDFFSPAGINDIYNLEEVLITPNLQILELTVEGGWKDTQRDWLECLLKVKYPRLALRELTFTYEFPDNHLKKTIYLKRAKDHCIHSSMPPDQYILRGSSCFCSWKMVLQDSFGHGIRGSECFVHDKGCDLEGDNIV